MPLEVLAVAALATWRIASMLYYDHGPWDCFERLRLWAGAYVEPKGFWGKQLACFWCCTFWAALLCAVTAWLWWYALLPFALSGAAALLSGGGRIIWREMVDG
jgi:hypothetical protein